MNKRNCKKCKCEISEKIAQKYSGYCKNCYKNIVGETHSEINKAPIIVIIALLAILLVIGASKSLNNAPLITSAKGTSSTSADFNSKIIEKIKDGTATSKEIEDLFVKNKNNEEYRSLYYYSCAKYYQKSTREENITGLSNLEKQKYYMKRISPTYDGTIANEIIDFGVSLFGSTDEWSNQYEVGKKINERQSKIYNGDYTDALIIYKEIQAEFDDYYKKNHKEADDEYCGIVFQNISQKYNIEVLEVNDIWENTIMNVSSQLYKKSSSTSASTSSSSSSTYTSKVTDDEKGYAVAVAKAEIKSRLKSPSSAKFPSLFSEYTITKSGSNTFTVSSYFDAQNSFGTFLRKTYTLKFTKTGSETYILNNVKINE